MFTRGNNHNKDTNSTMSKTNCMLLALAGAVTLSLNADAALSYNTRDLILGVRNTTGATSDLEVNIGPASNFYGATSSFVIPNVNLTEITTALGSFNSAIWSVFGASRPGDGGDSSKLANTLWVTRTSGSNPWNRQSNGLQQPTAAKIVTTGANFVSTGTQIAGQNNAATLDNTASTSYTKNIGTGGNFTGSFQGNIETTTSSSFSSTAGAKSIADLYELQPGTGAGTLLGSFEFSNSGTLTFVPVPEATTYGLMAGAGLLLLSVRQQFRRRQA